MVNTTTAGYQMDPQMAVLTDGGYVIVWTSSASDGAGPSITSPNAILAQRFAADGSRVGAEQRLDTLVAGRRVINPKVSALSDGGYVVGWVAEQIDAQMRFLQLQRFAADGSMTYSRQDPYRWLTTFELIDLDGGGFARVVEGPVDDAGNDERLRIERYSADSTLIDSPLADSGSSILQGSELVVTLGDGRKLLLWERSGTVGPVPVWAMYLNRDGSANGQPFELTQVYGSFRPKLAALRDGGFVLLEGQSVQDVNGYFLVAQRFSASGAPVGTPIRIDDEGDVANLGPSCFMSIHGLQTPCPFPAQEGRSIAGTGDGGFVVAWSTGDRLRPGNHLYARRFNAQGQSVSAPVLISSGQQGAAPSAVVRSRPGGLVFSWDEPDADALGIYVRQLTGDALN